MFGSIGRVLRSILAVTARIGGPWLVLSLLLFVAAVVLVLLGFDLNEVDLWIDAHGGLFEAIGIVLMRIFWGLVLLACLAALLGFLFDRDNPERPGWGCLIVALILGYVAWVGMTMAY